MKCSDMVARSFVLLGLSTFVFAASSLLKAQETAAPAETIQVYYEDEAPNRLDFLLLQENICLETVLRLNPELDIYNVVYGDVLTLPTNDVCYDYDKSVDGWWNFGDGRPPRLKYYEQGQWLAQPYYSDEVVYIRANSVEEIAHRYNICMDDLLADNILLQDFATYQAFATLTSFDIFIPNDAGPCNANWIDTDPANAYRQIDIAVKDLTPLFILAHYNICAEDVPIGWGSLYGYILYAPDSTITLSVSTDTLPCYNDAGQRLIYFNLEGNRLEQPVYSDLPVYRTSLGETMASIAEQTGVCLFDLLRINNFADLPTLDTAIEIFIPPARPCPDDPETTLFDTELTNIREISIELDICPEDLLSLNPNTFDERTGWYAEARIYNSQMLKLQMFIPTYPDPCYRQLATQQGDSIYDLERELNVCYQEFNFVPGYGNFTLIPNKSTVLYIRLDAPPCYNEQGQRLFYSSAYDPRIQIPEMDMPLSYGEMPVHDFQPSDTVYSLSQQYNICVRELLAVNLTLVGARPAGYPVFIPHTPPCYDATTGMPLIYEDDDGDALAEPQIADELIYYGSQPLGQVSYYYNVCANRIEAANQDKIDHTRSYLGWIIPTDRPPCYDEHGNAIDYVCYDRPLDFSVDYTQVADKITVDIDGTNCYDLAQPETVVWFQNRPYQIVDYENNRLTSRAFTAWCFGVSLADIDAINEQPDVLAILPLYARAIPRATRQCYVENPTLLDGYSTLHLVQAGETLTSIAETYGVARYEIAAVNDLDANSTIWEGQMLIIP